MAAAAAAPAHEEPAKKEEEGSCVKLLSTWRSMFGLRVEIALKERGVAYEYQEENLPYVKSALLLQCNPVYKKVPILIHKGKVLLESTIIVEYIDEVWPASSPSKSFLPHDPFQRSVVRFWADYVNKKVFDAGLLIIRQTDEAIIARGRKELTDVMITLEGALRDVFGGGTPYFGGQHINLVDIVLAPYVCWFETYERIGNFTLLNPTECPHLIAWSKAVVDYPSVKAAFSKTDPTKLADAVCFLRRDFLKFNK